MDEAPRVLVGVGHNPVLHGVQPDVFQMIPKINCMQASGLNMAGTQPGPTVGGERWGSSTSPGFKSTLPVLFSVRRLGTMKWFG